MKLPIGRQMMISQKIPLNLAETKMKEVILLKMEIDCSQTAPMTVIIPPWHRGTEMLQSANIMQEGNVSMEETGKTANIVTRKYAQNSQKMGIEEVAAPRVKPVRTTTLKFATSH